MGGGLDGAGRGEVFDIKDRVYRSETEGEVGGFHGVEWGEVRMYICVWVG